MKLQMIETKDGYGDWIYIYDVNDDGNRKFIQCLSFGNNLRTREQAINRATEIMTFCLENKGIERILEEFEYHEV